MDNERIKGTYPLYAGRPTFLTAVRQSTPQTSSRRFDPNDRERVKKKRKRKAARADRKRNRK